MLDKKALAEMREEFSNYDKYREEVIKKSRDVLKLSKQIIYAVHRDDTKEAEKLVKKILAEMKKLAGMTKKSTKLESIGAYKVSVGEYAEAMLYYHYVKSGKIPTHKQLGIDTEHYLWGLIDLTGELVRKAVYLAGKGKVKEVHAIRDLVDEIYGELLKFDFRDQDSRKKFDSVKYDLKKLENLVLDLKLKGR